MSVLPVPVELRAQIQDARQHKRLNFIQWYIIILPAVLYGCETWSLTLREEHRLRVLRRIFGPKRDGVTGE